MTVNVHQHIGVANPGISKSWRGWENVITARLLCPVDSLAEFKANPEEYVNTSLLCPLLRTRIPSTRARLRQGELPLIDSTGDPKFPAFLYDEDSMTDGSLTQGLFRGPFLLAVSLCHPRVRKEH